MVMDCKVKGLDGQRMYCTMNTYTPMLFGLIGLCVCCRHLKVMIPQVNQILQANCGKPVRANALVSNEKSATWRISIKSTAKIDQDSV